MFNSDFTPENEDEFRVVDPSEAPDAPGIALGDEAVVSFDDTFTFDFTPAPAPTTDAPAADAPATDTPVTDAAPAADAAPPSADAPPADAPPAVAAAAAATTHAADPLVAASHADDTVVAVSTDAADPAPLDPAADGFASDIPDLPLPGLGFDFQAFI